MNININELNKNIIELIFQSKNKKKKKKKKNNIKDF